MKQTISVKELATNLQRLTSSKDDIKEMGESAIEAYSQLLPHGSGFDGECYIDVDKSKENRIVIFFEYHHLNGNGYYDGWTEHKLILTPDFRYGFKMRITGPNKNQVKDYFYDMFGCMFE